ncbi:MAG: type II toxin-antitoxin system RelE/ParE family toxin [Bryobacteraceae bacterium]
MGYELELVQRGLEPSDWKAMRQVGPRVNEIRLHSEEEHRVFYVATLRYAIYVLHAFQRRVERLLDPTSSSQNGGSAKRFAWRC